jgi:hypothetical protein
VRNILDGQGLTGRFYVELDDAEVGDRARGQQADMR